MTNLSLAHWGWAVTSIEDALSAFIALGFTQSSSVTEDLLRKVRFLLLSDAAGNVIELVEPLCPESPVSKLLDKMGATPYHACFSIEKTEWDAQKKTLQKAGFLEIINASPAPALGGNEVIFLYSKHIGLVEIVLIN